MPTDDALGATLRPLSRPRDIPDVQPVPAPEVLADAIMRVSEGLRRLQASGLNRQAIVILLQADTGLGRTQISAVLNGLAGLATKYTEPPR